jgi:class 3 adenylate cyclase
MRCSKCGSDNREGRKFCTNCGTPLAPVCPKCGAAVESGESFCGECGTVLDDAAPGTADGTESATASAGGERRHLTILFCDLVGSVTLTSELDPEEWRATVAVFQRAASDAITSFGGDVVRYVGDGIMAFFGYPVAHDNDAERAARAGLTILDAIGQLNASRAARPKLAVRIGIDSGHVVVGAGVHQAVDAFGDAANIAARVQSVAEPDTVVATGATHRLILGLFIVQDRGAQALKGIERPAQLYRIVRPSGIRGRLAAAAAAGALTPFIGREDDLRMLVSRWERARAGEGQVILISGEAGIGKSRLVHRFREKIANTAHSWIECAAIPYHQNTPFFPVAEMLRNSLQISKERSASDRLMQLSPRLVAAGLDPAEAIPLLARFLDIAIPTQYRAPVMPPDQERRALLATLVEWVIGAARLRPSVIIIEDLHWADPSTLQLLQMLAEQGTHSSLLLLYTVRPDVEVQWFGFAHHTHITLNRLTPHETQDLIIAVAQKHALTNDVIDSLKSRSGGVPFFAEELTRAMIQQPRDYHSIPPSLQDSLMSRLDWDRPKRSFR